MFVHGSHFSRLTKFPNFYSILCDFPWLSSLLKNPWLFPGWKIPSHCSSPEWEPCWHQIHWYQKHDGTRKHFSRMHTGCLSTVSHVPCFGWGWEWWGEYPPLKGSDTRETPRKDIGREKLTSPTWETGGLAPTPWTYSPKKGPGSIRDLLPTPRKGHGTRDI